MAIGFAHLDSPILDHQTGLYEPWKTDGLQWRASLSTYITDGAKSLARSGRNERDGVMAVIQYRPSKTWTSMLDMYASRFKREDTANQFEVNLSGYNGGASPAPIYNPATTANGVLTGGTIDNVYPLVRGMYTKRKDDIHAA
ncbi:hypothetical protein LP420_27885 [Massilia sp. B-10]|nr:hypothetical protein LP420_27885 [Massilia sp. B-10]